MRTSSQLFPENKDTSVTNDMADIHSLAEDDLRDTELLIRMAIKNLKQVIEVEKLFEPVFADVFRTLRLAEEKACESAYWHGAEASQLTGGGKYQRTAVKASKSLDTKPDGKPAKELKDRLKLSRKNAGITQEVLALSSGTNQSTISQLESGLMRSSTHIPAIAKVLGVDAHWLQTGREDSASVKINSVHDKNR